MQRVQHEFLQRLVRWEQGIQTQTLSHHSVTQEHSQVAVQGQVERDLKARRLEMCGFEMSEYDNLISIGKFGYFLDKVCQLIPVTNCDFEHNFALSPNKTMCKVCLQNVHL